MEMNIVVLPWFDLEWRNYTRREAGSQCPQIFRDLRAAVLYDTRESRVALWSNYMMENWLKTSVARVLTCNPFVVANLYLLSYFNSKSHQQKWRFKVGKWWYCYKFISGYRSAKISKSVKICKSYWQKFTSTFYGP